MTLSKAGFTVTMTCPSEAKSRCAQAQDLRLVILDRARVSQDDAGLLIEIRNCIMNIPLVVMGGDSGQRIQAIQQGADLCLDREAPPLEFLAYVHALARRYDAGEFRIGCLPAPVESSRRPARLAQNHQPADF